MATATSKFLEGDSVAHFPLGGVAMGRGSERLAVVFQCISTVAAALAVILTEEQEGGPACCWWIWKPMGRTLRLQDQSHVSLCLFCSSWLCEISADKKVCIAVVSILTKSAFKCSKLGNTACFFFNLVFERHAC